MNTSIFQHNVEASSPLSFKLESFEGPLDLLLKLISKNKVDILDIPIAMILEQYMDYVNEMDFTDSEVAGDFISMAAELMLIKSKMLLPRQEGDTSPDPRASLVGALMDYALVREAAENLNSLYSVYSGRIAKESETVEPDTGYVAPQDLSSLVAAFERIERRRKLMALSKDEEPSEHLKTIATAKITPIHEKVFSVLRHMKRRGPTPFEELILENKTRSDAIATFIAILQLISRGEIKITSPQEEEDENPILEINYARIKTGSANTGYSV